MFYLKIHLKSEYAKQLYLETISGFHTFLPYDVATSDTDVRARTRSHMTDATIASQNEALCVSWKLKWNTYNLLFRLEHAHLAKADMEGWRSERAILLLDHHHIDGACQGRPIDLGVELLKGKPVYPENVSTLHATMGLIMGVSHLDVFYNAAKVWAHCSRGSSHVRGDHRSETFRPCTGSENTSNLDFVMKYE